MRACLCRLAAGFFLLTMAFLPQQSVADTGRVALVIGNGGYGASIGPLRNPANDAKLIARSLKKLGFTVTLAIDVDQREMKRQIRDFGEALTAAGPDSIGLFYYAGHGLQVDGENYLLPIGAEIEAERDVDLEAVSANTILSQMQYAGNRVNLIFLDACRNNPLSRGFRSTQRGLARVDAPRGSFVGYSTAPGDVSVDGDGSNSPYALALAEEMLRPGEAIEAVHRAVRLKVLAATNELQTPWDSSSLTASVILLAAPTASTTAAAPAPSPAGDQKAELLYWESAQASNNPAVFKAYLQQFPNGMFAALAQAKLEELSAGSSQTVAKADAPVAPVQTATIAVPASTQAEIVAMEGGYIAVKNANVRAAPKADAPIVRKLKAQESVTVTGRTPDAAWLQIALADGPGYVSAKLMRADSSASIRTPAPEPAPEPEPAPVAAAPDTPTQKMLRLSESLRPEIERYLANSSGQSGTYRFLAVNAAGTRLGLSVSCKTTQAGWGGWSAENCANEAAARNLAVTNCGADCRVIFKGASKVEDFDIAWVAGDGSETVAAEPTADTAVAETADIVEPDNGDVAPSSKIQTASAAPSGDGDIVRIAESLRPEIDRYLANSASQTGTYRFLAINPAGNKIGLSVSCKTTKSGWGGWSAQKCADEKAAMNLAIENCGSDCRVIFKGTEKIGRYDIEWY